MTESSIDNRASGELAGTSPAPGGGALLPLQLQVHRPTEVDRRPGGRRLRRALLLPLLGLLIAGGVMAVSLRAPAVEPTAEVDVASARDVVGLGTLVPNGDVVTLAVPSGAADARIETLEVDIGQRVDKGQVVAVLDNLGDRQRAVTAAESNVAVREASLGQTKQSVTSSRAETNASILRFSAAAAEADADLVRTQALFEGGLATQQDLEKARSRASQASLQVQGAQATLSRYGKKRVGSQADVVVALRNLESARTELQRAKEDLSKAQVRAPMTGVVLDIHARPGEKPGAAGVLTMANIDEMTVEVEVFQAEIGRVAVGDAVEVVAETLASRLTGVVSSIGLQVGRQSIIDDDPAANTDARVVTVFVRLDPDSASVARAFTHLQVVARIRPSGATQ